ncbi:hypothetical protein J2W40_002584 [Sphingobium xenophagum]|uniref:Uncharacterized protein n=1 Tax=Sphingobium xenophagum TaxID=121428 RepID=A0ABU1X2F5_SPHXE|nr:hypothetical protein [Sphingobium xenophagum]
MPDWAFERTVDEPSRGYTVSAADLTLFSERHADGL